MEPDLDSFIRLKGDEMHFDGVRYAEARGITVEEAIKEVREIMADLLPKASFNVVEN